MPKKLLNAPIPEKYSSAAMTSLLHGVIQAASLPVGHIVVFAGTVPPAGYLKCDGTAVGRSQCAALFKIIGVTYGAGDSSTTFTLPTLSAPSGTIYCIAY